MMKKISIFVERNSTKILATIATLLIWLMCYCCSAQTTDSTMNKFIGHWVGKPYRLGGVTERGIDCSQFNKRLYKEVFEIRLGNNCQAQWIQTDRIDRDSLELGDLVFFKSRISPSGWHCGTYIGNNQIVHAANRAEGVKISNLDEPRYKTGYKGAGRIKRKYITI